MKKSVSCGRMIKIMHISVSFHTLHYSFQNFSLTFLQLEEMWKGPENVESLPYIYVESREIFRAFPDFETINLSEIEARAET